MDTERARLVRDRIATPDAARTRPARALVVAEDPVQRARIAEAVSVPGRWIADSFAPALARSPASETLAPSVVVWDLGWDASRRGSHLAEIATLTVPVVVLAPADAPGAELVRAGAVAVLPRDVAPDRLRLAVDAVARGWAVVEPALLRTLTAPAPDASRALQAAGLPGARLTSREREVLGCLAEGLSNKEIAARLGISEHTAKFHLNAITEKLGVSTRTQAVVQAARIGWLAL